MPSYISHCIFADEVNKNVKKEYQRIVLNNYNSYIYGAQGPDLYFYYHSLPTQDGKNKKEIYHFGSYAHDNKINDCFKVLFEETKKELNPILISYSFGYICHHALDSIVHPYVYYMVGNDDGKHRFYEKEMDAGYLKVFNYSIKKYDYHKVLTLKKEEKMIISNAFYKMSKIFDSPLINLDIIKDMVDDIRKAMIFVYDSNGKKYKFVSMLEKLLKIGPSATSVMVPTKYDEQFDALNQKHQIWKYRNSNIERHEDCIELFIKAIEKANRVIDKFIKYLEDKADVEEVLNEIGNLSYNSGLIIEE